MIHPSDPRPDSPPKTERETSGITASSEWIGRLTGDVYQPTLTMKWSRMGAVRNASCKNNVK